MDSFPATWTNLIDDAAIFPPGNADLTDAVNAYAERRAEWWSPLVGSLVLKDTDLGQAPTDVPLSVVLSGGAGAVDGVVAHATKRGLTLAALEVALRDPDDLPGNARRIESAVRASDMAESTQVYVEIPGPVGPAWLAAADEVAAADLRLKFRLGNVDHDLIPGAQVVADWIDAALDRELRFKATAGLHRGVRHEPQGGGAHGFLNVLAATAALWDGGSATDAAAAMEQRDGTALATTNVEMARRWFISFGSCSVIEPLDDLLALGLLEKP